MRPIWSCWKAELFNAPIGLVVHFRSADAFGHWQLFRSLRVKSSLPQRGVPGSPVFRRSLFGSSKDSLPRTTCRSKTFWAVLKGNRVVSNLTCSCSSLFSVLWHLLKHVKLPATCQSRSESGHFPTVALRDKTLSFISPSSVNHTRTLYTLANTYYDSD